MGDWKRIVGMSLLILPTSVFVGCSEDGDEFRSSKSSDVEFTYISKLGSNVNDPTAFDDGAEVSTDELELYFYSDRAGGSGQMDIYVSRRATVADPWGVAVNVTELNSMGNDRQPSISRDGLSLYFVSDRTGGQGAADIYVSTRTSVSDPWGAPANLGADFNSPFIDAGPSISDDGLSLYIQSSRASSIGETDIFVSHRISVQSAWGAPTSLGTGVNSPEFDVAPDISSDGLTLYFHSTRPGGMGAHDIWKVTREDVNSSWGSPVNAGSVINSVVPETSPSLNYFWNSLYFASDADGTRDIWVAH